MIRTGFQLKITPGSFGVTGASGLHQGQCHIDKVNKIGEFQNEGSDCYRDRVRFHDSAFPGWIECMEFSMKKAVFLYDFTGLMAQPWLNDGYECWIFDGQHAPGVTREGNLVKVGMWFYPEGLVYQAATIKALVGDGVEMVFGFPECTDLTVAGAKHWEGKRDANPKFQHEAMALCDLVRMVGEAFGCTWGFENPVGALSTMYRKPDFSFHPCDYSEYLPEDDEHPAYPEIYPGRDRYNKNTCIWMGDGAVIPEKKRIEPISKDNPGWKKCGGKSLRTKNIRSATPRGFAKAWKDANS